MATTTAGAIPSRGSGSKRALIVALTFGLISAFLVFAFLNRSDGAGGGATVPVLVAGQDIPLGQEITDQNVTLKSLPTVAKHPNAFTDKTKASALHQVATVPLAAGEQILSSQVTKNSSEVGLAALIPEGHRAVAISVSEVTAGGGFIKAGDFVDVIGQFQANTAPPSSAVLALPKGESGNKVYVAATVLQNVKVLAIGQTAELPQQTSGTSADSLKPSKDVTQAKSVTLALTPDEAQKVFLAEQIGTLRLAGRKLGDSGTAAVPPQDNGLSGLLAGSSR
jgi:pilus assembly protein CpaB